MKNAVFCDIRSCSSCKDRCFGGTYRKTRFGELGTMIVVVHSMLRLVVTANFVSRSPILVTLKMEAILPLKPQLL
jgi:hypothetical protein